MQLTCRCVGGLGPWEGERCQGELAESAYHADLQSSALPPLPHSNTAVPAASQQHVCLPSIDDIGAMAACHHPLIGTP
jgi:hypothetical protein